MIKKTIGNQMHKRAVVLLGNRTRTGVAEAMQRLRPELEKIVNVVVYDDTGKQDLSQVKADFAIVFGGDGSILRAIRQMGHRQLPVLTVNLGTLAFLANVTQDELIPLLTSPEFPEFPISERILLECSVWRPDDGAQTIQANSSQSYWEQDAVAHETCLAKTLVVNEVLLQTGPPFQILHAELSVDHIPATNYRCDGLILSTPTGSTAHNLSTGGPILRGDLEAIVISPISPHTLSYRPVVDSADRHYEFRVLNQEVYVVIDGDSSLKIRPHDRVSIRKAEASFKMIQVPGHDYYQVLREKLGWNGQLNVFGSEEFNG